VREGWLRFGVEEEFLLVDPDTGEPVDSAPAILAELDDAAFSTELQRTQVEYATPVCESMAELHTRLAESRRQLAEAAASVGALLVAAGVPPFGEAAPSGPTSERYQRMFARYGRAAERYHGCGCHVHVEMPDRDTAVAVLNHIRPYLPAFAALGANSALFQGADTGYHSWRLISQRRFPTAGLPPWAASAAEYDARLDRLVEVGALEDRNTSFWLARVSNRYPTVEIRAADTGARVDDTVLQALLARGLAAFGLEQVRRGIEAPRLSAEPMDLAVWAAARYALAGPAVDLMTGRPTSAWAQVQALASAVREPLRAMGDDMEAERGLADRRRFGSGAQRQLRIFAASHGDPAQTARRLAEQTVSGLPAHVNGGHDECR
jgi:carboxylate-amine ligase